MFKDGDVVTCHDTQFTIDRSYVYMNHAEGTNQASNSPGSNNWANQISALHQYFSVSSHLRILKSAQDNTPFQQSFERIIGLFATFSFQDHN